MDDWMEKRFVADKEVIYKAPRRHARDATA